MLIKKSQAKKVTNSNSCIVWEYRFPSDIVSFAVAKINGRFPDNGRCKNIECEEIYYVMSGSGTVHSEFGNFEINKGDFYHFKKAEKYWVEGKDLNITLVNTPKWRADQYKYIH